MGFAGATLMKEASMGILNLIEQYESLPADRKGEVLDFVTFLVARTGGGFGSLAATDEAAKSDAKRLIDFGKFKLAAFDKLDPVDYQRRIRDEW